MRTILLTPWILSALALVAPATGVAQTEAGRGSLYHHPVCGLKTGYECEAPRVKPRAEKPRAGDTGPVRRAGNDGAENAKGLRQCVQGPVVRKQANCEGFAVTNRCSVPVRARLCAKTRRGNWSCYSKSPLAPGQRLDGACYGTGEVTLDLLPADSREKFPPAPGRS